MSLSEAQVHKVGSQLHVTHGSDAGLYVEFHKEPIHSQFKSDQAGRPVYDDVDFVTIIYPGDSTKKTVRPVRHETTESYPSDPQRWPEQWKRFQNQQEQKHDGLDLALWPAMTKGDVLSYKAMGIHTVEQLGAVADGHLEGLGLGARMFRDKARLYLDSAAGNAVVSSLQAQIDQLTADNAALKAQVEDIGAIRKRRPKIDEGE